MKRMVFIFIALLMVAAVVIVGCAKPASAAKKEYAHLVKPLSVQQPPAGLYTEPRI